MPTLKIATEPNPILRKKAVLVENPFDPEIKKLVPDLIAIMRKDKGIGIAAPQIGKSIQLIVVEIKDNPLVLFNPKILSKSIRKEIDEEGCLSVPDVFGMVKRHKKIKVEGLNRKGEKIYLKAEGLLARVLQHEIDHLLGILFIDKVIKYTKKDNNEQLL